MVIPCSLSSLAQEELVLAESSRPDGGVAQVLFRLGGNVTADSLERLCVKVGQLGQAHGK